MGRHARGTRVSGTRAPSDRGIALATAWGGLGTMILTAALLAVTLIGPNNGSGPQIGISLAPPSMLSLGAAMANLHSASEQAAKELRLLSRSASAFIART